MYKLQLSILLSTIKNSANISNLFYTKKRNNKKYLLNIKDASILMFVSKYKQFNHPIHKNEV